MLKVIDNVLRGILFQELGVGAMFKRNERYLIKIEEVYWASTHWNAVDMTDGTLMHIPDDVSVYPFSGELIVL